MPPQSLSDAVTGIAAQCGFDVVDKTELPRREPRYLPVPARLDPPVRELLRSKHRAGLYSHQAEAIEAALDGDDVCLATSTASGKSLVFIAVAADLLRRQPDARVLALYPARALIQDQIEKWATLLGPLGLTAGYIDGSVPQDKRVSVLQNSRVVLMTPDVAHAWLMSQLGRESEHAC